MKIFLCFLFFFLLNYINCDGDLDVECATLSNELVSEWKKVGIMKILTKTKKQAGIILNDDLRTILPCSSAYICDNNCTYLIKLSDPKTNKFFLSSISYIIAKLVILTEIYNRSKFLIDKKFSEKLEIFLNFNDEILGFTYLVNNYLEKHQIVENPTVLISESFEAPQTQFHTQEEINKEKGVPEEAQEKGFLQKYFWYIVIGGVLFFMFSSVDKEQLNESLKKAQEQAARQQR